MIASIVSHRPSLYGDVNRRRYDALLKSDGTETNKHTETDRQRQTETDRRIQTDTDRYRPSGTDRYRQIQTDMCRHIDADKGSARARRETIESYKTETKPNSQRQIGLQTNIKPDKQRGLEKDTDEMNVSLLKT